MVKLTNDELVRHYYALRAAQIRVAARIAADRIMRHKTISRKRLEKLLIQQFSDIK